MRYQRNRFCLELLQDNSLLILKCHQLGKLNNFLHGICDISYKLNKLPKTFIAWLGCTPVPTILSGPLWLSLVAIFNVQVRRSIKVESCYYRKKCLIRMENIYFNKTLVHIKEIDLHQKINQNYFQNNPITGENISKIFKSRLWTITHKMFKIQDEKLMRY